MKLGFIGMGKMANSIVKGLINTYPTISKSIYFYEKSSDSAHNTATELGITSIKDISTLIQQTDMIILCIKPQNLDDITPFIAPLSASKTLVSILAGVTMDTLSKKCQASGPIIRLMPNTPSQLKQGVTAICHNQQTPSDTITHLETLLQSIGTTVIVEESHMNIITAISGSGPAFFYQIAKDIAAIGQDKGLSQDMAINLVAQTLIGAGHMLTKTGKSPQALIDEVSSKGGTTVAGLEKYTDLMIGQDLAQVILAAYQRASEL
jgi:pyrroline-5-carboxylate reductase